MEQQFYKSKQLIPVLDYFIKKEHKTTDVIYKYKKMNIEDDYKKLDDIINNKRIYLPKRDEINDPFEGQFIDSFYATAGSTLLRQAGNINIGINKYVENYRFLSCSMIPAIPQMWAYYASCYEGVCLIYKSNKNFSNYKNIVYMSRTDRFETVHEPTNEEAYKLAEYTLLFKLDFWKQEQELRIIKDRSQEFIYFDKEELIGIIIGHKVNENYRNKIVQLAQKNDIEVYKTYLHNIQMKIMILPYDFKAYLDGTPFEEQLKRDYKNSRHIDIDGTLIKY